MHFRVSFSGGRRAPARPPVEVPARSWLSALAAALDAAGLVEGLERLACEQLPNGSVLARDGRTGQGFVIEPLQAEAVAEVGRGPAADDEDEAILALDADEEPTAALRPAPRSSTAAVVAPVGYDAGHETALARIWRAPTMAAACQAALAQAQRVIPCEAGSVLLRHEAGLVVQAATGPRGAGLVGTVLSSDRGVVGAVLREGVGAVVPEAHAHPRFEGHVDHVTGFTTRALMCAPLRAAADAPILGVMQLLNPPPHEPFSEAQLHALSGIAAVLAARIGQGQREAAGLPDGRAT